MRLIVVGSEPPERPKTVRLTSTERGRTEVVLNLENRLRSGLRTGSELKFEGVAAALTKQPFRLTLDDGKVLPMSAGLKLEEEQKMRKEHPLRFADLKTDLQGPNGSAHLMVWGRRLTQELADDLGEQWGVKVFVVGHQGVEMGYEECGDSMLIINSHHAHGVAVPIDLSKTYTRDSLMEEVVLLAGVLLEQDDDDD